MVLEYCEIAKPQGRGNIAHRCFFQDTTRVFRFDDFSKSTQALDLSTPQKLAQSIITVLGVKWYRYLDLKHHRDRHGHRNDRECTESCEVPCIEHKLTAESVEALINIHLDEELILTKNFSVSCQDLGRLPLTTVGTLIRNREVG